jgi:hypothetical protein
MILNPKITNLRARHGCEMPFFTTLSMDGSLARKTWTRYSCPVRRHRGHIRVRLRAALKDLQDQLMTIIPSLGLQSPVSAVLPPWTGGQAPKSLILRRLS